MNIAILASGDGSNAENLIRHFLNNDEIKMVCVITDNPSAKVICRAQALKIPVFCIPKDVKMKKREHEDKIYKVLESYNVDYVLLAGYMKILSVSFLDKFFNANINRYQVLNIHPSMLPAFPGLNSYKRAFDRSVNSGVTVHFVDGGVDSGEVLVQKAFSFEDGIRFEDYEKRGRLLEMELYPLAVEKIYTERSLCQL